jgi:hypothetical protein
MKSADDKVKALINEAKIKTGSGVDERILADALSELEKMRQKRLTRSQQNVWRIIMKNPITKLAVAAVVFIACLIGLSFWRTSSSGIALADVLTRIEKVKAVRYKWTYKFSGYTGPNKPYNQEIRATSLNSGEYGTKSTWEWLDPNGGESTFSDIYFLPQKKMTIAINANKTYMRRVLPDAQVEKMQKENPDIKDPHAFVRKILKTKYESLGRSTLDGIEVAGFRTTDPNLWGGKNPQTDFKLWVDVKTLLPVRYDILASVEVDEMGDRLNIHLIEHDFQWDVSVDPAEFEPPPVPEGYAVLGNSPDLVNEETTIQGLKKCVELLGNYPDPERLENFFTVIRSALEKSETPAALRLKEEIKGLSKQEKDIRFTRAAIPIINLTEFYNALVQDKRDPAYYGKTITPKDADKVLMRWKLSDNEYRVIYGDLHAENVTPEKLAELEAALPK